MFGGFMNGILKLGLIQTMNPDFDFDGVKFISNGWKYLHSLPLESKGSMTTAFCSFF
jgi:hypothetical protein